MKKIVLTLTALAAINLQSIDTSSLGNKETALAITAGLAGLYATGSVLCYAADIDICKNGKTMLMPFVAPFAALGMTGYASGYHLHWEMRIYDIQVDPLQWTKHDF